MLLLINKALYNSKPNDHLYITHKLNDAKMASNKHPNSWYMHISLWSSFLHINYLVLAHSFALKTKSTIYELY